MYIKTREYFKQKKIATFIGDIYFRETFMALRTHSALALSFDKENAGSKNEACSWSAVRSPPSGVKKCILAGF